MILSCFLVVFLLCGCGSSGDENNENSQTQNEKVSVKIVDDGGCFQKISFTVNKGSVLNGELYENITRINNGGKVVYFLGEWQTGDGEPFDFSKPVNEDVVISPQKTQLYFEEDNYPYITVYANEELKEKEDMKTVVLPIKSPLSGNSMMNSTLYGSGEEGSIFDSFNYIEIAVIPEEIHNVSGALFLNCSALREVYFTGYIYSLNRNISAEFLKGCNSLQHIYFSSVESKEDFENMLESAIAEAKSEGKDSSNLERFQSILSVKEAPYLYWDADNK